MIATVKTLEEKRDELCKDRLKELTNPLERKYYINGVMDMYNAVKKDELGEPR